MTPSDIEILLHYHTCPEPHPRTHAPAVQDTIRWFVSLGILEEKGHLQSYRTTGKGNALVRMLCNVGMPQLAWLDREDNIIFKAEDEEV